MSDDPNQGARELASRVLPSGVGPDDEVEVTWERDEYSTKVVATLGEASVTVETSEDGAEIVPWLVAALPSILEAAWTAIETEDETEETT